MISPAASWVPLLRVAGLAACSFAALGAAWWGVHALTQSPAPAAHSPALKTGIVTVATNSHRPLVALAADGSVHPLPVGNSLEEALSRTAPLPLALRLAVIQQLRQRTLTPDQGEALRHFISDTRLPEGLSISQGRALKNDVLALLCEQPADQAALAGLLRTLHADVKQDAGLRDYALQYLAVLAEGDDQIGWSTHWQALEAKDAEPGLSATAMIHLAGLDRRGLLNEADRRRLELAALSVAGNIDGPDISRTTALQICGRLKLNAAQPLAFELARSPQAGIPLRIAAVATLGDLGGDAQAKALLAALAAGPEKRLRAPARSAIARFSQN